MAASITFGIRPGRIIDVPGPSTIVFGKGGECRIEWDGDPAGKPTTRKDLVKADSVGHNVCDTPPAVMPQG